MGSGYSDDVVSPDTDYVESDYNEVASPGTTGVEVEVEIMGSNYDDVSSLDTETVNLTEVSSVNLLVFHLVVEFK